MVDIRRIVWNYGGAPGLQTGLLANRPAPSADFRFKGRWYGATDSGIYVDEGTSWTLLSGSGGSTSDASTTTKGITKLSTAPAVSTDPIAAGTNDSRMTNARTPTGTAAGELAGTYPNPTLLDAAVQGSHSLADNALTGTATADSYLPSGQTSGLVLMRITTAAGGNPAASGAGWPKENVPYFIETEVWAPGGGVYHALQKAYSNSSPSKYYFRTASGSGPPAWNAWQAGRVQTYAFDFPTVPAAGKISHPFPVYNSGDIFEIKAYMNTPPGASGTDVRLRRSNNGAADATLTGTSFNIPTGATAKATGGLSLSFDNAVGINSVDAIYAEIVASDATTPGAQLVVIVKVSI